MARKSKVTFTGDWGLFDSFLNQIMVGTVAKIISDEVKILAEDVRKNVVAAIQSHGETIGMVYQDVVADSLHRRATLSHSTLSGATYATGGTFGAPAFHKKSLSFTGAYANSIIVKSGVGGKGGVVAVSPDPTAMLSYYNKKGKRVGHIAVRHLAGMLEFGWVQHDGRIVPPRQHWLPVFFNMSNLDSYKRLASMQGIKLRIKEQCGIDLKVR